MSAPNQATGTPAPPAVPTAPSAIPSPTPQSTAALQQHLAELYAQRAGLQAQQHSLKSELDGMRLDNPGRPQVQTRDAQVAVQLAEVEGDIAITQAQLGKQGIAITRPPSDLGGFNGHITFGPSIPVSLSLILATAVILPFTLGRARRNLRRNSAADQTVAEIPQRLDRMEQAIDAIAIEMERVSESQRYMTKVMAERGAQAPDDNGAAPSVRALGAGPAQPIVVPEREAVRERREG